ncbi:glycosyltransferase [Halomonas sp. PGE1]|uniref:glycosyltransferase n=1 Tax=Halomonas sp. PGE1 TaxID=2730360 RepID=UPI001474731F|nr:glycosyltransferase [Halomonas sp. PGE1]QJQ99308.1 glycosyltransferase [Halomonas sp. PGE1]
MAHRILIVVRRMGMGGVEQATVTLANAMAAEGHQVELLVLKGEPLLTPDDAVTVHRRDLDREARRTPAGLFLYMMGRTLLRLLFRGSGFAWHGPAIARRLDNFVAGQEKGASPYDLILVRGQGAYELLWDADDPRIWQMVESVTGHHKGRRRETSRQTRRLYAKKKVVCVSEGIRHGLEEHLEQAGITAAEIRVIHNAVPLDRVRQLSQASIEGLPDKPYLVHVARLVPEKNQALLIDAFAEARAKGLDLPLVIVGDGSERPRLEQQAQALGVADHVLFVGQQANPYPWMARASALVLSSRFEALGLVLIEALALGTQCVATDAPGGIREVLIEEQARLITDQDPESLASAMLAAVSNPILVKPDWAERFSEAYILPQFLKLAD